jgi:hypothetical protein
MGMKMVLAQERGLLYTSWYRNRPERARATARQEAYGEGKGERQVSKPHPQEFYQPLISLSSVIPVKCEICHRWLLNDKGLYSALEKCASNKCQRPKLQTTRRSTANVQKRVRLSKDGERENRSG